MEQEGRVGVRISVSFDFVNVHMGIKWEKAEKHLKMTDETHDTFSKGSIGDFCLPVHPNRYRPIFRLYNLLQYLIQLKY
jgi:hypothetical protein